MTSASDIRKTFVEFFAERGHTVVPSSPLVPHNDPTLLFVNAGMVPFKNVFTGAETRDYNRAVSVQKCVRAGGKHNDLDNVGYTARHNTFFEMLGNFSFGDYFKERAIELAWKLVTGVWELPRDRLWVAVYPEDDEARALWRKISGLPAERIVDDPGNFWQMGPLGPCGYNSEIHYDHGPAIAGGPPGTPENEEGDRFVELWNLVFMQFEQVSEDERISLPKPSIDTGMGFERLVAILQGTHDIYATDLFRPLIEASAALTGVSADGNQAVSHRVVADHLRASSFLIADGVLPSNDGRGYVLRRIMRRAMRHVHNLGARDPLMWRLVPVLVDGMASAYPELRRAEPLITETLKHEETRFRDTLARGLRLLADEVAKLPEGGVLPGEVAFRLYDTYGFPVDLTEDVLRAQGRALDHGGFDAAMARQRAEARAAWAGSGAAATEAVWFDIRERAGANEFLGYETDKAEGRIVAIVVDGHEVERAEAGADAAIVTNQTPFYAEAGGQMGDTGLASGAAGARFRVRDTVKRLDDVHVHIGRIETGRFAVGDIVDLEIDAERRAMLRANHSATHLLHAALRNTLGPHVTQKGSLVAPDRLRFDFSHSMPIPEEEIEKIETEVNRQIRLNAEVVTRLMTPEEGREAGALALFGEKYGDEVRVLTMGVDVGGGGAFSTELCGGTHVRRTGDIGFIKIVNQSAIAAGVRRIEAVTGDMARAYIAEEERQLRDAAQALKTSPAELADRIGALLEERRKLERELVEMRRRLASGKTADAAPAKEISGIRFSARALEGIPPKELRGMVDALKAEGPGVYAVLSATDGKAAIAVGVTEDLTDRVNAVDLVRRGVAVLGGKGGGGRPDMAQGGGPDASRAEEALSAIERSLAELAEPA